MLFILLFVKLCLANSLYIQIFKKLPADMLQIIFEARIKQDVVAFRNKSAKYTLVNPGSYLNRLVPEPFQILKAVPQVIFYFV